MKKNIIIFLYLLIIMSVSITGCSNAPMPQTPTEAPLQPTVLPTHKATPVPSSPTPSPTEVPPPSIPCTIAFDSDRDANLEIYTMDSEGKNLVNISNNPGDDFAPAWSPNGSQIAFASNRVNDKVGGQFIYVMNADGSNIRQLSTENESKWPDWSNDGNWITYSNKGDIYSIKSDGTGKSANLTNSPEVDQQSSWSPDSKIIAWLSGNDENWNVVVMESDGSNKQQLTFNGKVHYVQWTVDGQLLAPWDHPDGICGKCIMNADGTDVKEAGGKGELQKYLPYWTKDGLRVECVSANVQSPDDEIYLVGEAFPDIFLNLTNNPAQDRNPVWPANCGPVQTASESTSLVEEKAQPKKPEEIVIGYEGDKNSMSKQKLADLGKACSELGVKCINGESITKLVEQDVDAVISFSNRWHVQGSYPEIHEAVSKGIPVIILDAESSEQGVYNLSIESDSIQLGLEWMFDEIGSNGEFAYYNFGNNDIHQSIIDQTLKDNPGIKGIAMPAEYEGNSLTEESIAELATTNSKLGGIWTNDRFNDVFWGLRNGDVEPIPAILCEPKAEMLREFWPGWINDNTGFNCFSTIKPGGTGYEGVYVAYFLLTGEEIDPKALGGMYGNSLIYAYPVITNENLDEWIGKINTLREGEWGILEMPPMTPEQIKEMWFLKK